MSRIATPHRWIATFQPAQPERRARLSRVVLAQAAVLFCGIAGLAMTPPDEGAMLLVPVAGAGGGSAINMALAHGATLLGPGPWPGTVVVRADRHGLPGEMLRGGVLAFAAVPMLCGSSETYTGTRA